MCPILFREFWVRLGKREKWRGQSLVLNNSTQEGAGSIQTAEGSTYRSEGPRLPGEPIGNQVPRTSPGERSWCGTSTTEGWGNMLTCPLTMGVGQVRDAWVWRLPNPLYVLCRLLWPVRNCSNVSFNRRFHKLQHLCLWITLVTHVLLLVQFNSRSFATASHKLGHLQS